jgi:hypothetical protein
MNNLGDRYNTDKLRWHNFPMFLVRPLAQVGHYGEKKYATYNFLKGLTINCCLDSLKRHLDSFEDPTQPDIDPESNLNHLAHIAWNALVALYMLENKNELDDRFKLNNNEETKDTKVI